MTKAAALPPRATSFMQQNMLLMIAVLVSGQLMSVIMLGWLVLTPQAQRAAGIIAQAITAVSASMSKLPETDRAQLINTLNESEYLHIWAEDGPPPSGGARPRFLERVVMQALVEKLHGQNELQWRTDARNQVWVSVELGGRPYWISARTPGTLEPLGAMVASAIASVILALLAGVLLQRRIGAPLEALASAADNLRPNEPPPQFQESGPREIASVGRSFNSMAARLAVAEQERALMLAGVSHDLRTPLAKVRLAVEMMSKDSDQELAALAARQIDEIDRMLSQFLSFTRGLAHEAVRSVDVDWLLADIVETQRQLGYQITLSGAAGALTGRPDAIRRALVNIIENAMRHGRSPIDVTTSREGSAVTIAIADRGLGIPEAEIETVRQPFVRGDIARSAIPGTGLGLAIAESVATLHRGSLTLKNRVEGGLIVTLSLQDAAD